jgi:two-component system cell cycle sensor histidine kinase/response regulator CckA
MRPFPQRALACLVALALTLVARAQSATDVPVGPIASPLTERQPLLIGAAISGSPYGYQNSRGEWEGFAVELLDEALRTMKLTGRRVGVAGLELQERFRRGEFDVLQGFSDTPERQAYADFTVPYLVLNGAIFVAKDHADIASFSELNGKRFAVQGINTIGEKFVRDHGLEVDVLHVSSSEDGLQLINEGRCDAIFVSRLTALAAIDRRKLTNVVMLPLEVTGYDIRHCFAVHKGDAVLLARLNEGLALLHRSGRYDEIYTRWFGRYERTHFSRQQLILYVSIALGIGLLATLVAFWRQRTLRRRIVRQAAELARQEQLLRALHDSVPQAMCVFEATARGAEVISLNRPAEQLLRVTNEQARGCRWEDLPLDAEWRETIQRLLDARSLADGTVRQELKIASTRQTIAFTVVTLTGADGGAARFCLVCDDVTERRQLDDELAQTRKLRAIGELVGGIAHEFNNLLTPVMLKVSEIQLSHTHDATLQSDVKVVLNAVRRAADLTRRLLTFGRKSSDHFESVLLSGAVESCLELLRHTIDRRIRLETVTPSLPPLIANPTSLNQIILNLVLNARDTLLEKLAHCGEGWQPEIRVEIAALPLGEGAGAIERPTRRQILGWQRLTVRDNGLGMRPEVRERIFEPFYTTKEIGKGTGLGLATVWHLVTEMSGRVEVESTPGEGSIFHVLLPVLAGRVRRSAADAPLPSQIPADGRVFMAEDDELVASAMRAALERAGYRTTHFAEGAAAWQHLQSHFADYDLLVLDVNMPGMDGITLVRHIAETGQYRGRIIVASGRLDADDMQQLRAAKVDALLLKPFGVVDFLEHVRKWLAAGPRR